MEIDLKHLAKCLRKDGIPDLTYIGQHLGVTPGWSDLAAEVLLLTDRITALEKQIAVADGLAKAADDLLDAHWNNPHGIRGRHISDVTVALAAYRAAKGE